MEQIDVADDDYSVYPGTALEAKSLGLKHFYTGQRCNNNHLSKRLVSSKKCCACLKERHDHWVDENRDYVNQRNREWSRENREKCYEMKKNWQINVNPELYQATTKAYNKRYGRERYELNGDAIRAKSRERRINFPELVSLENKRWRENNPERVRDAVAKRCTKLRQATPPWVDWQKIEEIYAESIRMTKETGVKHSVDHRIPLQGKIVCGLHVHTNMRVMIHADNIRKKNKFDPDNLE